MRDALVFGVDSDTVRKKCIAEGNKLTFQEAHEIAGTEKATKRQLQAMTNPIQVNSLRRRELIKGKSKPKCKPHRGQRGHKGKEYK